MPTPLLGSAFSARPFRLGLFGSAFSARPFRLGLFGSALLLCLLCLVGSPAVHAQSPTTVNDSDTSLVYVGSGWGYSPNRGLGDVSDDAHATATNGDSVSYTFTGTDISYVTETAPDEGNVQIFLDGTLQAIVNCYSATRKTQQTVWSRSGYPPGTYTLKLVKQDGGYMLLDAVRWALTPNFLLGSNGPTRLSLGQGSSGTTNIVVTPTGGFTGTVALTATGLPTGVTASFSPASVSGNATSIMTLTAAATAPVGLAAMTLTATSGTLVHTGTVRISVTANPILTSIIVSPASAALTTGGTQTFTAVAKDQNGAALSPQPAFTWTVTGVGTVTSAGVYSAGSTAGSATVKATSGTVSGTAVVTVTAASSTPPYLSNLTISPTAIIGGNGATGTVTLSSPTSANVTVALHSNNSAFVVPASVVVLSGATTKTFSITTLTPSEVIYPTITAKSNGWIQAVVATVLPANQSFTIQNLTVAGGNQCVVLNWSDLPAGAIQGYKIYRRLNSGTATLLTPTPQQASTYADMGLTPGTPYSYQVSIVNVNGQELNPSAWTSATPDNSSAVLNFVNPPSSSGGPVQGPLRFAASLSSGINSLGFNLLIDGVAYSEVGEEASADGSSSQGSVSAVTVDTTMLTNGTHIVQMISEPGDPAAATPLLSLQVSNPISHDLVTSLADLGAGEAINIDANVPASTTQWQVTVTSESDNSIIRSWQGVGNVVHLAWDGTDISGASVADQYYTVNAAVLAPASTGTVVSPNVNSDGSLHRSVTTPTDGLQGLALIDRIDQDATHTDALAANVKAAFAQMKITDGNFRGTVLLPPQGQPKQAEYAVYRKIRKWLTNSVLDFYVYGHGRRQEAVNSPKPQRTAWGKLMLYPLLPTDPSEQVAVTNDVRFIVVPQLFTSGSRQGYNFVFIDSCYSAGGPTGTETNSPSGEPRLSQWQQAFTLPDGLGDGNLLGTPCFIGWNGLTYTNTFYNGKMTNFMRWRQYFWTNLAVNGTTVENAANKATSATIDEINRRVTQNGFLRPWDTTGPYSRSVRIDSSLTLLP